MTMLESSILLVLLIFFIVCFTVTCVIVITLDEIGKQFECLNRNIYEITKTLEREH